MKSIGMGSIIVYKPIINHFTRKYGEASRIYKLWYPRPKPRENAKDDPKIAERIFLLLEYGYTVDELSDWFRLNYKSIRASTNTKEANAIFEDIKAAYNFRCAYCGKKTTELTKDHVVPISKGGKDRMDNIVPSCLSCNLHKSARNLLDWSQFRKLQLHLLGFE